MFFLPSCVWTSYDAPAPIPGLKTPANWGGPPPRIWAPAVAARASPQKASAAIPVKRFVIEKLLGCEVKPCRSSRQSRRDAGIAEVRRCNVQRQVSGNRLLRREH